MARPFALLAGLAAGAAAPFLFGAAAAQAPDSDEPEAAFSAVPAPEAPAPPLAEPPSILVSRPLAAAEGL